MRDVDLLVATSQEQLASSSAALADRKAELTGVLQSAQQRLLAILDRVDQVGADGWNRPTDNAGWTLQDVTVHLATAEHSFVPLLRRIAAGQGGVPEDFDRDRWNASQLRRHREEQPAAVRQTLQAAHEEMLSFIDALDATSLRQRGLMSSGGVGSVEDALRLVARHKTEHTLEMERALSHE